MPLTAATAENAKLDYEAGQTAYAMEALTDSGDQTIFTSNATYWSNKNGYAPDVKPNGIITGGNVIPDNAEVNDTVDISALTCYLAGVKTTVNAGSVVAARGGSADLDHIINSIVVTDAGALDVITGTGHATAHNTVRGSAGGPPYVTVGYIEIAQVKYISHTSAAVTAAEIHMVPGASREVWNYPLWDEYPLPEEDGSVDGGSIKFHTALEQAHTGDLPKGVYAEYYDPVFAEVPSASNFKPPETSHSVSSAQVYNGTIGGRSSSLGQGGFTQHLRDGVSDVAPQNKNEILTFRFYPDRYKDQFILCQGKLGITRTFPAGDNISAECTISCTTAAVDQNS